MKRVKTATNTSISLEGRICSCKRSACRKKYCECFRLNKLCTPACKCVGCCNKELHFNQDDGSTPSFMNLSLGSATMDSGETQAEITPYVPPLNLEAAAKKQQKKKLHKEPPEKSATVVPPEPQVPITVNFITPEVVDSVVKCMLAQAQECMDCGLNQWQTERMILDTFGGCMQSFLRVMGIQVNDEASMTPTTLPVATADCRSASFAHVSDSDAQLTEQTIDLAGLNFGEAASAQDEMRASSNVAVNAGADSQFIDVDDNAVFNLEVFTKLYQENPGVIQLGNFNNSNEFIKDE